MSSRDTRKKDGDVNLFGLLTLVGAFQVCELWKQWNRMLNVRYYVSLSILLILICKIYECRAILRHISDWIRWHIKWHEKAEIRLVIPTKQTRDIRDNHSTTIYNKNTSFRFRRIVHIQMSTNSWNSRLLISNIYKWRISFSLIVLLLWSLFESLNIAFCSRRHICHANEPTQAGRIARIRSWIQDNVPAKRDSISCRRSIEF